jgi:O-antigen/teichoic acid export membrane protein
LSRLKTLYKQTFVYGLATVVPKMLSFLLVRLHTDKSVLDNVADYGDVSLIFAYFVLFNVMLAYGMETAFFRFFNSNEKKQTVLNTSAISLLLTSTLVLVLGYCFKDYISNLTHIDTDYIKLVLWILFFDALVIIPFAYLRALGKPIQYTALKLINVILNLGLNIVLLLFLKSWADSSAFWDKLYQPNYEVHYIFIANLVASAVTLLLLIPFYFKLNFTFKMTLWKQMLRYAIPVLVAGVAFSINETFDRILLERLLPENLSKDAIGTYSACYKLALFMTLFATAYRLGIEPFFFSNAKDRDAKDNYAKILEFFVIFGALILLVVVVFVDIIKLMLIPNEAYWEAMAVVPILLLAYLFLGVYHNLSVWYKVTDRTKFGAYISIIGALVTLGINIIFIPQYGYMASATATLLAYAIMASISYALGQKYYAIPYNLKKIGLYISLSVIFSILSFYYFRENYTMGTLLILVLSAIIWFKEKTMLKQLLKS